MKESLKSKLRAYLAENNMDLFLELQDRRGLTQYLDQQVSAVQPLLEQLLGDGKPGYIIEETCLKEMTASLRPSRYNYVMGVLEEEFEEDYERLRDMGVLTYEVVNMTRACAPYFDEFGFSEANENSRHLRYIIIGTVSTYLENKGTG